MLFSVLVNNVFPKRLGTCSDSLAVTSTSTFWKLLWSRQAGLAALQISFMTGRPPGPPFTSMGLGVPSTLSPLLGRSFLGLWLAYSVALVENGQQRRVRGGVLVFSAA